VGLAQLAGAADRSRLFGLGCGLEGLTRKVLPDFAGAIFCVSSSIEDLSIEHLDGLLRRL